jgi:hypothetical protein
VGYSLNETISLGATWVGLIALKDDLLKLAERLENLLEVRLGDAEVDVANVETVEGCAVEAGCSAALGGSSRAVLLSFGKLRDDGDALEFLTSQFQSFRNRFLILELNVTDSVAHVSM